MEDNELVEVTDLTFLLAVPGQAGEPAKLRYTVREHLGDGLNEAPGALTIQFGPRDLPGGRRLTGKKVTIASSQLVGLERDVRLEPRVRPSAAMLLNPEKAHLDALKAAHGVAGATPAQS